MVAFSNLVWRSDIDRFNGCERPTPEMWRMCLSKERRGIGLDVLGLGVYDWMSWASRYPWFLS